MPTSLYQSLLALLIKTPLWWRSENEYGIVPVRLTLDELKQWEPQDREDTLADFGRLNHLGDTGMVISELLLRKGVLGFRRFNKKESADDLLLVTKEGDLYVGVQSITVET